MIPLAVPNLAGNEAAYLQACIDTGYVSSVGAFVDQFEASVAAQTGAPGAVAVSAGTTGLHACLVALGVRPGDLVLTQSLTFIATASAIAQAGADAWLLDVSANSWTLDPDQLQDVLATQAQRAGDGTWRHRATGRRLAALMPVFTLGCPADMARLEPLARHYGLPIVADAAAAQGARHRGQPLAQSGLTLGVYSFNGNKTVTSGGGGAVFGPDAEMLAQVRHLTTTARRGPGYDHDAVGFNYRMTNLQAAVGCAQMEQLDGFIAAKRAIDAQYRSAFADLEGIGFFPQPPWATPVPWLSGVLLPAAWAEDRIERFRSALREEGVDVRPFWKPVHLQPPYATCPAAPMPRTEALWPRICPLPCSTHLDPADQARVIDAVKRHWGSP